MEPCLAAASGRPVVVGLAVLLRLHRDALSVDEPSAAHGAFPPISREFATTADRRSRGSVVVESGPARAGLDETDVDEPLENSGGIDLGCDDGRRERDRSLELLARTPPCPVEYLRSGTKPDGRILRLQLGDERGDGVARGIG